MHPNVLVFVVDCTHMEVEFSVALVMVTDK